MPRPVRQSLAGWAAAFLLACLSGAGQAQAGDAALDRSTYTLFNPVPDKGLREYNPDRPTKASTPFTIDAGHFEIESDFLSFSAMRQGGSTTGTLQAFDPVIKLGLTQAIDIQVMTMGLMADRATSDATGRTPSRNVGTGDVIVRSNVNLFGNEGGKAALSITPYLTVPSGDTHFGAGQVQGGVLLPLYLELPNDFELTLQTEFDALADENSAGTHANFVNIVNLAHPVPGVKDLKIFAELYSSVSAEQHSPDQYTFDTALAYLVDPNTQLDIGANIGLDRDAPRYQVYSGVAHRF